MGTGPMKIATLQNVPESLALLHSSFLPLPYLSRRCGTVGDLWAFHEKVEQVAPSRKKSLAGANTRDLSELTFKTENQLSKSRR